MRLNYIPGNRITPAMRDAMAAVCAPQPCAPCRGTLTLRLDGSWTCSDCTASAGRWHLIDHIVANGSAPWPDVDQIATDAECAMNDDDGFDRHLVADLHTAMVLGEDARRQLVAWAESWSASSP